MLNPRWWSAVNNWVCRVSLYEIICTILLHFICSFWTYSTLNFGFCFLFRPGFNITCIWKAHPTPFECKWRVLTELENIYSPVLQKNVEIQILFTMFSPDTKQQPLLEGFTRVYQIEYWELDLCKTLNGKQSGKPLLPLASSLDKQYADYTIKHFSGVSCFSELPVSRRRKQTLGFYWESELVLIPGGQKYRKICSHLTESC